MTHIEQLIAWYEEGVLFWCGCRRARIDPMIRRELLMGRWPISALLRCPIHDKAALMPDPNLVH